MRPTGGPALLRHEFMSMSQSDEWDIAKTEWRLHNCWWNDTYSQRICGHEIKERCVINNTVTDRTATVVTVA